MVSEVTFLFKSFFHCKGTILNCPLSPFSNFCFFFQHSFEELKLPHCSNGFDFCFDFHFLLGFVDCRGLGLLEGMWLPHTRRELQLKELLLLMGLKISLQLLLAKVELASLPLQVNWVSFIFIFFFSFVWFWLLGCLDWWVLSTWSKVPNFVFGWLGLLNHGFWCCDFE